MKVLNQHVARMYVLTICLLAAFDIASSYGLGRFPYALLAAMIAAPLIEIAVGRYYLKKAVAIPFSGIITGMIIGSVAPISAPVLLAVLASAIAVLSKFFIKIKSTNVLNPASIGLLIALAVFGAGDQWWAASSYNVYGIIVSFTPLFIISAYEARRLISGLSFVLITFAIGMLLTRSPDALTILTSINYLFAFVMVADPKTSPNKGILQVAFGGSVSAISAILIIFGVPYALLIALLVGNVGYGVYRGRTGIR